MTAQDISERSAPTTHSLHVNWFRREPGGTTIFVMPPDLEGAAVQSVTERDDGAATCLG